MVIKTFAFHRRGYANDAGTIGFKLHSDVIMPYIEEYGTSEQQQRYIPGMTNGKLIGCLAMTEPQAGRYCTLQTYKYCVTLITKNMLKV